MYKVENAEPIGLSCHWCGSKTLRLGATYQGDCNIELCRELCEAYLRRYTDDPAMPNSVKEFQWLATHEFNTRLRDGEISFAEFGVIIDMILSF